MPNTCCGQHPSCAVYFVEGILDMASLAVNYYLKDTLGLGPSAVGAEGAQRP